MKTLPYDYGFDLQETFNLAYDWKKYALQKKNFLEAISWNFPVNQEIGLMDLHDELDNFIERNLLNVIYHNENTSFERLD